jgi:hypothetical protein
MCVEHTVQQCTWSILSQDLFIERSSRVGVVALGGLANRSAGRLVCVCVEGRASTAAKRFSVQFVRMADGCESATRPQAALRVLHQGLRLHWRTLCCESMQSGSRLRARGQYIALRMRAPPPSWCVWTKADCAAGERQRTG